MDTKTPVWRHQVTMVDREEIHVEGVVSLGSYDEKEICMETGVGSMHVTGEGLNVKQLNLQEGKISVEGNIKGVVYEEPHTQRRGLLNRLLK